MRLSAYTGVFYATVVAASVCQNAARAADTYYVSPTGSDNADGLTPATAWKSADKVNNSTFAAGSQILFERGGEWRERLLASSSGTTADPIVYGAYGSGAKPKFWGSDIVEHNAFTSVAGTTSTYKLSSTTEINSFFADHNFFRSADLNTTGNKLTWVNSTPGSYYFEPNAAPGGQGGTLYVNTGGVNPAADSRVYSAGVREAIVSSNEKNNLVFRDLVTDESAKANGGYGFWSINSDNVRIENSESYRAGKHNFGAINTNGFVGVGLKSAMAMPDQGFGGATAYVSFSDANQGRVDDSYQWINCDASNFDEGYLAFYTHGTGVGDILVKNMTADAGIAISTDGPNQHVRVEGGRIDNAGVTLYGNGIVVDGMHITGPKGAIGTNGNNNVVQNVLIEGVKPDFAYKTAAGDGGQNNVFQFNTIVLDPTSPGDASAFALVAGSNGLTLRGNLFVSPVGIHQWAAGLQFDSSYNLYSPSARFTLPNFSSISLAQWQAMGFDANSLQAFIQFVDAAGGDYRLAGGSLAIDGVPLTPILVGMPVADYFGQPRPEGGALDFGAFEAIPEPGSIGIAMLALGYGALRRRRR